MLRRFCLIPVVMFLALNAMGQKVNYSPEYFGPNANPVPRFGDARIPGRTTLRTGGSYWMGKGENTGNLDISIEVPLLPECVSLKVWATTLEGWSVTPELYAYRQMTGGKTKGMSNGDIYVQTRMRVLKEKEFAPSIVLNATLKTASGTDFDSRRYFDTPGYYFDVENGDRPLVYGTEFTVFLPFMDIFAGYRYGIIDFPFHHFQLGLSFSFASLTPKYK